MVVARRRIGIEHEVSPGTSVARPVLEFADAQLRALQVDQDADRPAVAVLDGADRGDQLAHPLVRGVAHVDAEDIGARLEQPGDDRPLGGGRTERCHDLGPAQPSHRVGPQRNGAVGCGTLVGG